MIGTHTKPGTAKTCLVLFFITVCCVGLVGRLAYIQFWGEELRAEAVDQRMRELRIPAKRGIITTRADGNWQSA